MLDLVKKKKKRKKKKKLLEKKNLLESFANSISSELNWLLNVFILPDNLILYPMVLIFMMFSVSFHTFWYISFYSLYKENLFFAILTRSCIKESAQLVKMVKCYDTCNMETGFLCDCIEVT